MKDLAALRGKSFHGRMFPARATKLRVRDAHAGQSLSEYALAVLQRHVATPTLDEIADRISKRTPPEPVISIGELIREERDARSA